MENDVDDKLDLGFEIMNVEVLEKESVFDTEEEKLDEIDDEILENFEEEQPEEESSDDDGKDDEDVDFDDNVEDKDEDNRLIKELSKYYKC